MPCRPGPRWHPARAGTTSRRSHIPEAIAAALICNPKVWPWKPRVPACSALGSLRCHPLCTTRLVRGARVHAGICSLSRTVPSSREVPLLLSHATGDPGVEPECSRRPSSVGWALGIFASDLPGCGLVPATFASPRTASMPTSSTSTVSLGTASTSARPRAKPSPTAWTTSTPTTVWSTCETSLPTTPCSVSVLTRSVR